MRTTWALTCCWLFLVVSAGRASAQNLFEVQVFPDEILKRGETEVEFHSVVMPSGTRLPDRMLDRSSHVHMSFELSHGWSDRFETGVFLETSPSMDDAHAAFTGFHFRPKYRFNEWQRFPFHVSVSAEYAFVKNPGDLEFRQALAVTPIFERHLRSFELSLNPSFEFALRGPDAGGSPVFEPSAKLAARVLGRLARRRVLCGDRLDQAVRTARRAASPPVPDARCTQPLGLGRERRRRSWLDRRERALGAEADRRTFALKRSA